MRRYGIDSTLLVANRIEALLAIGDWDEADRLSAAALRGITSNFPYWLLIIRADVEIGRGDFDAARAHLEAASRHAARGPRHGLYDAWLAELALVGAPLDGRRTRRSQDGLAQARQPRGRADPRLALRQGTARPGGAGGARARPPGRRRRSATGSTARGSCSPIARRAAAEAAAITPNAAGWLALAEAEYERARGDGAARVVVAGAQRPGSGSSARRSPPTAAGARPRRSSPPARSRAEASVPLREAHAVAARIGAEPAAARARAARRSARGSISTPPAAAPPDAKHEPRRRPSA